MKPIKNQSFQQVAELIKNSKHIVVFTGAGISTDSGIPDFTSNSSTVKLDNKFMMFADPYYVKEHEDEMLKIYQDTINQLNGFKPNIAHEILAKWQDRNIVKALITQNVDGFHQLSGSKIVYELHGNVRKLHCTSCGAEYDENKYFEAKGTVCKCGGYIRPSLTFFNEALPEEQLLNAFNEAREADLLLVIGSSLRVAPANFIPQIAKVNDAKLVIINSGKTQGDKKADIKLDMSISEALIEIDKLI